MGKGDRQPGHELNGDGLKLVPKNWTRFQHYKDRCPPWIKLHKNILDDRQFMCLPLASKALAPLLWLLASESKDGSFDADVNELSFRLRMSNSDIVAGINPLIKKGFFLDARTMLAPRLQVAVPETEAEGEREGEAKENTSAPIVAVSDIVTLLSPGRVTLVKPKEETDPMFFRFWEVYDYRVGKQKALKAWKSIKPDEELAERIIAAAELYSKANPTKTYYKHASTWLNGRHWEDDPATLVPKIARQAPQLTAQQATKLAASRTIFGDERTFHDQRTIDITPPQIAG